ncbi:MAG: peptidoglycan-associated lipoprotein Pal [Deltaproteobacteria bacterium]|nr:peptidoglycan-associated lipoprotein Pal [Deltaproteobacteria bacterium]
MLKQLISPLFAVIFGAGLALQACAPASVSTNGESSPEGLRTSMIEPANHSGSSLEAMRRGELADSGPLKDVHYEYDQYNLRADARETLKRNAEWLKANPAARVEIEGHADERGTNQYNLALGAKRAQTSRDFLTSLGITADRLNTVSYGEEVPACREQTEGCWQKNRRARFMILSPRPAL